MSGLPFVTLNDAAPQDMNESPTVCVGLHLAYHHRNIQHAYFQTGLVTSERASMFVLSLSVTSLLFSVHMLVSQGGVMLSSKMM